jgi:hypothetical protein
VANYKVMLTVKDCYGNEKEVESGDLNINLAELTEADLKDIEEALPLENFVTKEELEEELADYSLTAKVPVYVPDVTPDNMLVFTLQEGATEERLEFDIDKSNDWDKTDGTAGSSYLWEPMQ